MLWALTKPVDILCKSDVLYVNTRKSAVSNLHLRSEFVSLKIKREKKQVENNGQ